MNPTDQARKLFGFFTFYLPNAFILMSKSDQSYCGHFLSFLHDIQELLLLFFLSSDMCLTCLQQFIFSLQEKKPGDVN